MSQSKFIFKVLICSLLLTLISFDKSDAVESDKDAAGVCRLSKAVTVYSSYGSKNTTTYEVDNQSRLVKEVSTYEEKDASQNSETVTTNTYDAEGFLTQRVTNTTLAKADEYTAKSVIEKFSYVDGKLQKTEASWIYDNAARNTNSKTENKYDGSGNLSERLSASDGEVVRYTYSNGKLTGIVDPKNTYIINDKGYVTKKTESTGGYTVYNYNVKGQPINEITYNEKGEKAREDAHEFSTTLWKAPTNPVPFKGHPSIPAMYGDYSFLETKYKVSYLKVPGTKPSAHETVYTHEVDRNGNLTKHTSRSGSGTTVNKEITDYTYVGCK